MNWLSHQISAFLLLFSFLLHVFFLHSIYIYIKMYIHIFYPLNNFPKICFFSHSSKTICVLDFCFAKMELFWWNLPICRILLPVITLCLAGFFKDELIANVVIEKEISVVCHRIIVKILKTIWFRIVQWVLRLFFNIICMYNNLITYF